MNDSERMARHSVDTRFFCPTKSLTSGTITSANVKIRTRTGMPRMNSTYGRETADVPGKDAARGAHERQHQADRARDGEGPQRRSDRQPEAWDDAVVGLVVALVVGDQVPHPAEDEHDQYAPPRERVVPGCGVLAVGPSGRAGVGCIVDARASAGLWCSHDPSSLGAPSHHTRAPTRQENGRSRRRDLR